MSLVFFLWSPLSVQNVLRRLLWIFPMSPYLLLPAVHRISQQQQGQYTLDPAAFCNPWICRRMKEILCHPLNCGHDTLVGHRYRPQNVGTVLSTNHDYEEVAYGYWCLVSHRLLTLMMVTKLQGLVLSLCYTFCWFSRYMGQAHVRRVIKAGWRNVNQQRMLYNYYITFFYVIHQCLSKLTMLILYY